MNTVFRLTFAEENNHSRMPKLIESIISPGPDGHIQGSEGVIVYDGMDIVRTNLEVTRNVKDNDGDHAMYVEDQMDGRGTELVAAIREGVKNIAIKQNEYAEAFKELDDNSDAIDIDKMREFAECNRLLSVVIRSEKKRSMPAREVQLQSLMKWEDDMNEVLKQAGRQKILVYNDVDEVMARTNFQYILSNKYPEELVAFWKGIGSSCACSCEDECAAGTKCCPSKGCWTKVVLARTDRCGWGFVALEDIQANAFVVEYVGEVITAKEAIALKDRMYRHLLF